MAIFSNSVVALATGGGLLNVTLPTAPTISAAVDNGDQDSITVTVVGTGTIQLYYRLRNGTTWTTGNTRSGNGDITETGLDDANWYEFYITDTINSVESTPSAITMAHLAGVGDTTIETALFTILDGDADTEAIVGARIYPAIVYQTADLPAVTFQQISGARTHTAGGPISLANPRFQVNCWAETYAESRQLAETVRKCLDGYSGTVNTRAIDNIALDNELDTFKWIDSKKVYGKMLDFIVWFHEAT